MDILIDSRELADLLRFGLTGYLISVFIISPALTIAMLRLSKGRRGVFVMVVLGLLLVFVLAFYGVGFLLRHVWDIADAWGWDDAAINGVCLALALLLILFIALPLRLALNDEVSPLRREYESLTDEQLSPLDIRRREHQAKYDKRR
jgi:uncharacterized membrane protein